MPSGGLLVGGGLAAAGGIGSYLGGKQTANASQNVAQAQLGEQQQERGYAINAAQATPQELQAMQSQLSNMQNTYQLQQTQLNTDMNLAQTINPQLQSLLNGGNAPILQPYQNLMNYQQQQMQGGLAKQLGSGWQTSSVGQQANQTWGLNAAMQGAQLQQSALGQLGNLGLQANQQALSGINASGQTLAGLNQGLFGMNSQLQAQQIAASEGTSLTPYSGAGNVASGMMGNTLGQLGGAAMGIGGQYGSLAALQGMMPTSGNINLGGGTGFNAESYASSGMAGSGGGYSLFGGTQQ